MPYTQAGLPYASADSDTSRDAALRALQFCGQQGLDVLAWFRARGDRGGSQIEASAALGIARASMCARVRALEQAGELVKTTERRGGCAVYKALAAQEQAS